MGILDILSSAPKKNPYAGMLSDEAWAYYQQMQRRKQIGGALRGVGDYLNRAAVGDYRARPTGGGGRGGSQDELMRMMKMHQMMEASQDRSAKRQRQQTKDTANAAVIAKIRGLSGPVGPEMRVRGYPGAAPVTVRALPPRQPMSGLRNDPEFIESLMAANPKSAIGLMFPGPRKAPKTRRRIKGSTTVQEQWDPKTGEFTEIGRGPRFKSGGGITPAQQANNAEIGAARRELAASGMTRKEILSRAQKATETGFENSDYDPFIGRLVRAATQRKVGDDPEFEQFHRRIFGTAAPTTPPPAATSPASLPGVAGTVSAPPRRTPPPTERELRRRSAAKPDIGEQVVIQGRPYEILDRSPDGRLMVMDLGTGQQFFAE